MMILVFVIGGLMNLIVFLLYYRLEKLTKKNGSDLEVNSFKGVLKNDLLVNDELFIQFKEVVSAPSISSYSNVYENEQDQDASILIASESKKNICA